MYSKDLKANNPLHTDCMQQQQKKAHKTKPPQHARIWIVGVSSLHSWQISSGNEIRDDSEADIIIFPCNRTLNQNGLMLTGGCLMLKGRTGAWNRISYLSVLKVNVSLNIFFSLFTPAPINKSVLACFVSQACLLAKHSSKLLTFNMDLKFPIILLQHSIDLNWQPGPPPTRNKSNFIY